MTKMRNEGVKKTITRAPSFSSSKIALRRTAGDRRNEIIHQLLIDFWIQKGKPPWPGMPHPANSFVVTVLSASQSQHHSLNK
jgi:hypothetical protein